MDGSIAFYVTAERKPDGEWIEPADVRTVRGDRLTYVPASAIKRVEIRNFAKTNAKAGKGADSESGEAAVEAGS